MRIALLSDTHVPTGLKHLPEALMKGIRDVDAILHAGDIVTKPVLDVLQRIAPTTAVAGNMDPPELKQLLKGREVLEFGKYRIGLHHGHQSHGVQSHYITESYDSPHMTVFFQLMHTQLPGAEIIVFGHFHRPVIKTWNDILFINPGAVVSSHGAASYAILELADAPQARIISLPD